MYIRFHGNYSSPYTKQPYGIFVIIYHLHRDGKLSEQESATYLNTVDWYEELLPNPPYYEENNNLIKAITWFKANDRSEQMINKLKPFFDIAEK